MAVYNLPAIELTDDIGQQEIDISSGATYPATIPLFDTARTRMRVQSGRSAVESVFLDIFAKKIYYTPKAVGTIIFQITTSGVSQFDLWRQPIEPGEVSQTHPERTLQQGEAEVLSLRTLGLRANVNHRTLPVVTTTDDATIASIVYNASTRRLTVRGVAVGNTNINVSVGKTKDVFPFTITPAPQNKAHGEIRIEVGQTHTLNLTDPTLVLLTPFAPADSFMATYNDNVDNVGFSYDETARAATFAPTATGRGTFRISNGHLSDTWDITYYSTQQEMLGEQTGVTGSLTVVPGTDETIRITDNYPWIAAEIGTATPLLNIHDQSVATARITTSAPWNIIVTGAGDAVGQNTILTLSYGTLGASASWEIHVVERKAVVRDTLPDNLNPFPPSAPETPAPPTLVVNSSSQIAASWVAADRATSYDLQRADDANFTTGVDTENYTGTQAIVTGLNALTTYYFRLKAKNNAGESDFSESAHATTQRAPTQAPAVPGAPILTVNSPTEITVSWVPVSGADRYDLMRATNRGFTSGERQTTHLGTSTQVTGLRPNTTYWFRLRARNSAGRSRFSESASARTGAPLARPPAVPGALRPTVNSDSQITLRWRPVSGATSYDLQRATDPNFTVGVVSTNYTGTTAVVTGLAGSTRYYFRLRSSNTAGDSRYGSSTSATTPAAGAEPGGLQAIAGVFTISMNVGDQRAYNLSQLARDAGLNTDLTAPYEIAVRSIDDEPIILAELYSTNLIRHGLRVIGENPGTASLTIRNTDLTKQDPWLFNVAAEINNENTEIEFSFNDLRMFGAGDTITFPNTPPYFDPEDVNFNRPVIKGGASTTIVSISGQTITALREGTTTIRFANADINVVVDATVSPEVLVFPPGFSSRYRMRGIVDTYPDDQRPKSSLWRATLTEATDSDATGSVVAAISGTRNDTVLSLRALPDAGVWRVEAHIESRMGRSAYSTDNYIQFLYKIANYEGTFQDEAQYDPRFPERELDGEPYSGSSRFGRRIVQDDVPNPISISADPRFANPSEVPPRTGMSRWDFVVGEVRIKDGQVLLYLENPLSVKESDATEKTGGFFDFLDRVPQDYSVKVGRTTQ